MMPNVGQDFDDLVRPKRSWQVFETGNVTVRGKWLIEWLFIGFRHDAMHSISAVDKQIYFNWRKNVMIRHPAVFEHFYWRIDSKWLPHRQAQQNTRAGEFSQNDRKIQQKIVEHRTSGGLKTQKQWVFTFPYRFFISCLQRWLFV